MLNFEIMKKLLFVLWLLVSVTSVRAAVEEPEFSVQTVSAQVKSYQVDSINLTSPLHYFLSRAWVRATGRQRHWADISTSKFAFDRTAPDEAVDDDYRAYVMNEWVDRVVTYRDSVGAVVTHNEGDGYVLLNYCWIEDGRWVNGGQDLADDLDGADIKIRKQLPENYVNLPRIARINRLPGDSAPFTAFLHGVESTPEQFVLDMLASHRLVINGELHRRKVSWDMLKRLIALPDFA